MSDYPDEILFLEDYGESENGISRWTLRASFGDGTKLTAYAEIPKPPEEELTPRDIQYYDPITGETGVESDGGQQEAWELETKTTAYRTLHILRGILAELPERPKKECPSCSGHTVCPNCDGSGCLKCKSTGLCDNCDGRGWVFAEN